MAHARSFIEPLNCLTPGCSKSRRQTGYCGECSERIRSAKRSKEAGATGRRLTEDDKVEIRRRSAKFQSPRVIAKAMGCSEDTVRVVLKAKK